MRYLGQTLVHTLIKGVALLSHVQHSTGRRLLGNGERITSNGKLTSLFVNLLFNSFIHFTSYFGRKFIKNPSTEYEAGHPVVSYSPQ